MWVQWKQSLHVGIRDYTDFFFLVVVDFPNEKWRGHLKKSSNIQKYLPEAMELYSLRHARNKHTVMDRNI